MGPRAERFCHSNVGGAHKLTVLHCQQELDCQQEFDATRRRGLEKSNLGIEPYRPLVSLNEKEVAPLPARALDVRLLANYEYAEYT